jgi:hypothetical protein
MIKVMPKKYMKKRLEIAFGSMLVGVAFHYAPTTESVTLRHMTTNGVMIVKLDLSVTQIGNFKEA